MASPSDWGFDGIAMASADSSTRLSSNGWEACAVLEIAPLTILFVGGKDSNRQPSDGSLGHVPSRP
jgi:hypothetical protein